MSFSTNLQYLRSERNMTQERLAVLVGVSRQAISKWESEKAYPEMDKLLILCDIFDCKLDDLVTGDLKAIDRKRMSERTSERTSEQFAASVATVSRATDVASEQQSSPVASAGEGSVTVGFTSRQQGQSTARAVNERNDVSGESAGNRQTAGTALRTQVMDEPPRSRTTRMNGQAQDVTGYDEAMKSFAWRIAVGVALLVASFCPLALFGTETENVISFGFAEITLNSGSAENASSALQFVGMTIFDILGLAFIIPAAFARSSFRKAHPFIEDFYTQADHEQSSRELAIGIVAGIALIMLGVAVPVSVEGIVGQTTNWSVALMFFMVALGVFSFVFTRLRRGRMNIAGYNREKPEDNERKSQGDAKRYENIMNSVCGIIMLIAAAVGFILLFTGVGGFWLSWIIGGFISILATAVGSLIHELKNQR